MASSQASEADFDEAPLASISDALPKDDFRAFIEEYLMTSRARLDAVQALDPAATADLKAEAHRLISTAGSYGLQKASALARRLETACAEGRTDEARALVGELLASARKGLAELQARFLK